jgi:hypothetical protein
MNVVEIFPTLLATFEYPNKEELKSIFLEEYKHLEIKEIGEHTGNNDVHHNPKLDPLYNFVVASASEYLKTMEINLNNFYIVIGKSWLSYVNAEIAVPMHAHADHHLSFTYYVDLPNGGLDKICFTDTRTSLNEPFYGAFNTVDGVEPNCRKENKFNSKTYQLNVKEGTLCMFPSKLNHWTFNSDVQRKCIAGDILLIYKNRTTKNPWGIHPPEHWKYYETKMD